MRLARGVMGVTRCGIEPLANCTEMQYLRMFPGLRCGICHWFRKTLAISYRLEAGQRVLLRPSRARHSTQISLLLAKEG